MNILVSGSEPSVLEGITYPVDGWVHTLSKDSSETNGAEPVIRVGVGDQFTPK